MHAGDKAWIALAAGILTYETLARDGELLSESADRWMESHPWTVRVLAYALAAHVCNAIPHRFDPLHLLSQKGIRRRAWGSGGGFGL